MITTLISLYAAGTLAFSDTTATSPHTMPWNDQTTLEATPVPHKEPAEIAPVIKAKAAIAVDLKNGLILYEKNIHQPLPIASLTKLMTAVIILEENDLKEVAEVSKKTSRTEGSKIWLAQGEKITVENLLYGTLINSANDAAAALAEFNSGSIEKFVEKMNAKALDLGLIATTYVNPTGLNNAPEPADGKPEPAVDKSAETPSASADANPAILGMPDSKKPYQNYSTAYDLTLLARYAYGKSFVRRAVVKKEMEVSSTNEKITHKLKNTNELLDSYLKVLGLKTGTTDEAGECLIAIIENEQGHDVLTVVLNSPARYSETKILADWVFRAYKWN
jgi:serine-type D-Ala-D-Ala carboxypeptidase (penicillin-binding protein 5/6)